MMLRFGDVVLIEMLFLQAEGSKIRPAVVVLDTGDQDFVAAPITSRPSASEFDLVLTQWQNAGLNVASTVRLHKISVLAKGKARRTVGRLDGPDLASMRAKLCEAFCRGPE